MSISDSYVGSRYSEIAQLLNDLEARAASDSRLAAHIAGYLDVLIVGAVEDAIEHLINKRGKQTGDVEIEAYVRGAVHGSFRNPDWSAISGQLGRMSEQYKADFRSRISPDGSTAQALHSLLGNKNALAHEGSSNLHLTIADVRGYFERLESLFEAVEAVLRV